MREDIIVFEEEIVGSDTATSTIDHSRPRSVQAISPTKTSRRLVMAGIGAVVIAGGKVKSLVNRFIESERLEVGNAQPRRLQKPVDSLLMRLNVPTKTDVDALNSQVTALLDKIEALQEQQQRPSLTSPIVTEDSEIERVGG
jgi:hypothetical protein